MMNILSSRSLAQLSQLFNGNTKWLERQQTSILSAASIITVASILSAISGLLVKRELINIFFDTPTSQKALEAFWVAFQIPDMMFQLVVLGALSAAFIPLFTQIKNKNLYEAFRFSSTVMNLLMLIFIALGTVVFIFAEEITYWRTGDGFTAEQVEIVTNLTRLMLFSQFFFAVSNFMTGMLQSFQRFIIPAIAPLFYNLGILFGTVLLVDTYGIYAAGIGVLMGAFLHMIIQIPLAMKLGFRYNFSFNLHYTGVMEFFRLTPPRVVAVGTNEMRRLFLGFFATSLGNLSFFVMQLALVLMAIPIRFFGVPIGQASLPFLSDQSGPSQKKVFRELVIQSLHQISFFAYPASVLLLILRIPIVRLVYGTANFPWESTLTTGRLVSIIAISIGAQALVQLLVRAFYALKDTKTPLLIALIDVIIYVALTGWLVFYTSLGVYGIALATSITALLELVFYLIMLDRKIGELFQKAFWIPQLKMVVASFLMAVFTYLPFRILDELVFDTSKTVELIALTISTGTIGAIAYSFFASLFEIHELTRLLQLIYTFGKWEKPLAKSTEVLDTGDDGTEVI